MLVLLSGAWMRIAVWFQGRSIFIDEANLIRNWTEKEYSGFWHSLDYEQFAPPLYSMLNKAVISLGGVNEWTVRLGPLICSLLALVLFYRIGRNLLFKFPLFLASGFFAWGLIFIQYATETKQYSSDLFVALLLVYLAEQQEKSSFSLNKSVFWAAIGSLAVWFSMPSVFVLAGVGLFFLWKNKNDKKAMSLVVLVAMSWVLNFLFYFFSVLKADAQLTNLRDYHSDYFLAFPPTSLSELSLLGKQLSSLISIPFHYTFLPLSAAVLCFLAGFLYFRQLDFSRFLLWCMPIVLTLAASAFGYYSLIGRLVLFLFPFVLIIAFYGLDVFIVQMNSLLGPLLILFLCIGLLNRFESSAITGKITVDEPDLIAGIQYTVEHQQENDGFFAYYNVAPTVRYYAEHRQPNIMLNGLELEAYRCCGDEVILDDLSELKTKHHRIWMLWDRPDVELLKTWATQQGGTVTERLAFHRGVLLLFEH